MEAEREAQIRERMKGIGDGAVRYILDRMDEPSKIDGENEYERRNRCIHYLSYLHNWEDVLKIFVDQSNHRKVQFRQIENSAKINEVIDEVALWYEEQHQKRQENLRVLLSQCQSVPENYIENRFSLRQVHTMPIYQMHAINEGQSMVVCWDGTLGRYSYTDGSYSPLPTSITKRRKGFPLRWDTSQLTLLFSNQVVRVLEDGRVEAEPIALNHSFDKIDQLTPHLCISTGSHNVQWIDIHEKPWEPLYRSYIPEEISSMRALHLRYSYALGNKAGHVMVYDIRDPKHAKMSMDGHDGGVDHIITLSAYPKHIMTCGGDGMLKRWDLRYQRKEVVEYYSPVRTCSYLGELSGERIGIGGSKGDIYLFNYISQSFQWRYSPPTPSGFVSDMHWHDNRLYVSIKGEAMKVFGSE